MCLMGASTFGESEFNLEMVGHRSAMRVTPGTQARRLPSQATPLTRGPPGGRSRCSRDGPRTAALGDLSDFAPLY